MKIKILKNIRLTIEDTSKIIDEIEKFSLDSSNKNGKTKKFKDKDKINYKLLSKRRKQQVKDNRSLKEMFSAIY